jgi:hyperosmotically inducible protein
MIKNPLATAFCVIMLLTGGISVAEKSSGEHVDDSTLTARVKLALLKDSAGDAMDINVETSKGVVQLAGFVGSEKTISRAGEVAAETEGVVEVSNRLRVHTKKRSMGRTLDDTVLAAKVKLALTENDETSAHKVNVEIRAGVVELSGFVTTYAERDAAVKLVSGIDGVKDIINSIDITR